ncbi:hypothetical protein TYRP_015704 [Tyrophagus putrescentiae]|nr:hypothetical protein TYRP_015704 [Tyrophagus putrescentiae]
MMRLKTRLQLWSGDLPQSKCHSRRGVWKTRGAGGGTFVRTKRTKSSSTSESTESSESTELSKSSESSESIVLEILLSRQTVAIRLLALSLAALRIRYNSRASFIEEEEEEEEEEADELLCFCCAAEHYRWLDAVQVAQLSGHLLSFVLPEQGIMLRLDHCLALLRQLPVG